MGMAMRTAKTVAIALSSIVTGSAPQLLGAARSSQGLARLPRASRRARVLTGGPAPSCAEVVEVLAIGHRLRCPHRHPIGVLAAVRADSLRDYVARSAAILGLSVPGFWLATLVILLPPYGGVDAERVVHRVRAGSGAARAAVPAPAAILGVASAAGIMRLTRAMLLEVLRQDYVRTAWAKGLTRASWC